MDECRIYYFLGMLLASSNDYIPVSLKILVFSQLQPRCLHLQLVAVAYCSCSEAFAGTPYFFNVSVLSAYINCQFFLYGLSWYNRNDNNAVHYIKQFCSTFRILWHRSFQSDFGMPR